MRSIEAIGFDMDYTLIHYRAEAWEQAAYEHLRGSLVKKGWPVKKLRFDPDAVILGLVLDLEHGNLVKANRFGFVKQAMHGTQALDFDKRRALYSRSLVDLREPRWAFLNTLFSMSEACMYAQLVDLLDKGALAKNMSYAGLHRVVRDNLDLAHMEGSLKARIMARPEDYVVLDETLPLVLQDFKQAGKKLLLITNSEWSYTQHMMAYAFDQYLPAGQTWRDLFDLVVVSARKPAFFAGRNPFFKIIDQDGRLLPQQGALEPGAAYLGGDAGQVEAHLGLTGEQILYVGDHIFADVNVSKNLLRWRTALIIRDLEAELDALESNLSRRDGIAKLMKEKEQAEHSMVHMRLELQRHKQNYGPKPKTPPSKLRQKVQSLKSRIQGIDDKLSPLLKEQGKMHNSHWGLLLRTGNDKSHLARQIEGNADLYTSRVSNLGSITPFGFLRSPRTSLPHDLGESVN